MHEPPVDVDVAADELAASKLGLARPKGYEPADIRHWIGALCLRLGLSPTELSRRAGVVPSTINRFLASQDANANLSGATIAKLGRLIVRSRAEGEELAQKKFERSRKQVLLKVTVVGRITHTPSAQFWPEKDRYQITIPGQKSTAGQVSLGYEIDGDVADLVYPHGSIVIGALFSEMSRGPRAGDNIITISPRPNNEVLYVIGKYAIDSTGSPWLTFLTSDPRAPERIPTGTSGWLQDPAVLIVSSFRPEA